jgi:hypothetical protein
MARTGEDINLEKTAAVPDAPGPVNPAPEMADIEKDETDIKALLQQNLELTRKLAADVHAIKRHIGGKRFWNWFWIILFVASLVWSAYYLPPLMKQLMDTYNKAAGQINSAGQLQNNLNLNNLDLNAIIKH